MNRAALLLLAAVTLYSPGAPSRPALTSGIADSARLVVLAAYRAVESDSVAAVRSRWEVRLRRDPADRAARLGVATIALRTFDYDRAEREYAAVLARSNASNVFSRQAAIGQAHVERYHRSFAKAGIMYQRVLDDARTAHDTTAMLESAIGVSHAAALSAGPLAAKQVLDSAIGLVSAVDAELASDFRCARALQMFYVGNGVESEREERLGLALARQAKSRSVEGVCLTYLAANRMTAGDVRGAFLLFDSAEVVQRQAHDHWNLAATFIWRGFLDVQMYDHAAGLRDATLALREADTAGAVSMRAWGLRNLAHIEWHTSDLVAASEHLSQAAALMHQAGDDRGYAALRVILGGVTLDLGKLDDAARYFTEDLAWATTANLAQLTFEDEQALAQVRMRRGAWSDADRQLREAASFGRTHALLGLLPGLEYDFGLIALRQGNFAVAERHFLAHLASSTKDQRLDRYSARSRLAEVYLARGDPARAGAELTAATDELEAIRAGLDERGLRVMVFQTHRGYDDPDVGFSTIVSGLVRAGNVDLAFQLAERRRARQLADEMLRAQSLRVSTATPAVSAGTSAAGSNGSDVASLRARVPDDRTAVLEYVVGRGVEPTTVFVLTRLALRAFGVPTIDSLDQEVDRFARVVQQGSDATPLGSRLRGALLDSVIAFLPPSVDRLIIVPDGALHHLPFDALVTRGGQPLMARYGIALAPSVAVAAALWSRPASAGPASVLALGDPAFGDEASRAGDAAAEVYGGAFERAGGLPRLRASAREARMAASFGVHSELRLREAASESWLKHADFGKYQIVHLATHALVDENSPMRTALALARGNGDDGFVGPAELAALQIPVDLVVLSACRTAGGMVVGGEGVQGLTAPLLQAGAGTVVATLWPVGDRGTLALITAFYRGLAHGLDVLDALHAAKLDAFARHSTSAQWAGFVLVGNPSTRIALTEPAPPIAQRIVAGALVVILVLAGWVFVRSRRWRVLRATAPRP